MLDLMPALAAREPAATGERCAVATVVGAGGSVPRPVGTSLLVSGGVSITAELVACRSRSARRLSPKHGSGRTHYAGPGQVSTPGALAPRLQEMPWT